MKYRQLRFLLLSMFAMLCGTVFADEVTMAYIGTTTSNMTGENDAATMGLDATAWSVVGDKGANNNMPGLNKAGDFRLYWSADGGNTVTVESLTGATINNIAITFTGDDYSNVSVRVNGNAVSGSDGVYTIGASKFVLGNANTSNVQVRIKNIVINYSSGGTTDTRAATTVTLGDHATTAEAGNTIKLPTATVTANGSTVAGAQLTWTSSKTDVATIAGNAISCAAAGTTTITATYAGDANYKASSASFVLTVTAGAVTINNFQELQEKVTSASTPATINFNGVKVLFVSSSNAFLSDANGYGGLVYTKNHGLEAGQTLTGTINANITLYQGNAEITNFTKEGLTIGTTAIVPVEKTLSQVGNANQSTLITVKNLTYSTGEKDNLLSDGTNSVVFYDKFKTGVTLEDGKAYDVTGIVVLYNGKIELCPRTADDIVAAAEEPTEPAEFQPFEITNADMSGTFDTSKLPAGVTFAGTQRGDSHGYGNVTLTVPVNGAVKFTIGGCQYANPATCKVTNAAGELLAEPNLKTATCYHQDGASVTYIYEGEPTTLTFSNIAYLPYFKAEVYEPGPAEFQDFEITNADMSGTFDTSKLPAGVTFTGTQRNDNHGYGNVTLTVPVTGKVTFTIGGCQYANPATCKVTNAAGELLAEPNLKTATCYHQDGAVVTYIYKGEPTTLTFSNIAYLPYFKAEGEKQKEKITLDNEAATVAFPFNEGTEGQKAEFSNADYFLSSKVAYGSNLTLKDKNTLKDVETEENVTMTRFEPATKLDTPDEASAVRFSFTPKPGFTFKPTKIALKASRYGTDNGLIDVTWEVANGTNLEIAKAVKPERNNKTPNISKLSYDIADAAATEGTQTLLLHLYSLQESKQFGVSDIVIEGIMNGTEKDVPVLASFKVNGNEYAVEDVFGELYEATLKLPKAEAMVSKSNPLTDVTAKSGTVGDITYDEKENACTVTIPMTSGDTQMNYVLNVIFKPDYKLEYIGVDGSVLATQTVEEDATIGAFAYDIANATATKEGYKARGWFKTAVLGEKFTTADVITANTKLYAIQTEIEVASTHKKYNFDLTDKFFYAEDHEAFTPAGDGFYWHDKQHGWAFKNGNTVDLLVGPKAVITVTLCQYGSGTGIAVKKDGQTLETLPAIAESDGGAAVYNYEGEAGTLTLEMQCGGEMYIHGVKIVNTAEVNFESQGNWYFVKAGDAGSFMDVLDVVNGKNASKDAARSFIFLPNGTYDLDATVKTAITGHNISIIGQSMDKTIIVTTPDKSMEGLGSADLFHNSGSNLYLQDLTLKNALDYYNAGSAGRAAVLQDAGTRTIGKNVRMLSYQDTYYSSNSSQQAYWENCDIHGTVDFICGGGDIRFQNTTISLEPRKTDGSGGRTIVAPTTNTQFGYVFDGCKVVDLAEGKGNWNYGRTWQNEPITVYLNTTLDDNAAKTLVASRWTEQGMNGKDPKLFGEYGTKDMSGKDITPASNKINSYGGAFETILSADQAAAFAYDKMFTDWAPAILAHQIEAPADAKYDNGTVTFGLTDNGMMGCAIFKNGEFAGLSFDGTFNITVDPTKDALTIRCINEMGGLGPEASVTGTANAISTAKADHQADAVYTMQGVRVNKATKGLYIINGKKVVMK